MEVAVTTGAISRANLQSNHHHQHTNTQFFYRPDALPVTQPTVSKHWRENITFHGLAYPNSPGGLPTLSLITNSCRCQHPKGLTWSNLWKKGQCIITRRTATTLYIWHCQCMKTPVFSDHTNVTVPSSGWHRLTAVRSMLSSWRLQKPDNRDSWTVPQIVKCCSINIKGFLPRPVGVTA